MSEPFAAPISATTRYCAVYGHPVKHSASPAMQNAAIAALGLDWRYLAFDVHPNDLRDAIAGAKAMKFIGLNLTVPHKLLALDMVDVLDESARTWGAVNTIRFEGQDGRGNWKPIGAFDEAPNQLRSVGFNTDADAIAKDIRYGFPGFTIKGAAVVIAGMGGAGRVAALKLAEAGAASLFLINRTIEKSLTAAKEVKNLFPDCNVIVSGPEFSARLQKGFPDVHVVSDHLPSASDLLVNGTSLGLRGDDPLPVDEEWLRKHKPLRVYDMVYRPAETRLLAIARSIGCDVRNGLGMLLYQGAKALEIWSGKPAPVDTMRRALEQNVYGR